MTSRRLSVGPVWLAASLVLAGALEADWETRTTRVSVGGSGAQANGLSRQPAISADGRVIAFTSRASNLVPGDTNGRDDVFVHERETGQTFRVSVTSAGVQGTDHSFEPAISADGRFVAFSSYATLVGNDTNGVLDVYVRDRVLDETTRVSVDSGGTQANFPSYTPSLSADGCLVAFASDASNLVPADRNGQGDIFVHDRCAERGRTAIVSVDTGGRQGNRNSRYPSISADGRFVAFESAVPYVPEDTNGSIDVFVHEIASGHTSWVSYGMGSAQPDNDSIFPALSSDGRFVAFRSDASNLVPGDTNGSDIFVHDRQARQTRRVNVAPGDTQAAGAASFERPAISGDGRFVAFATDAANLVAFNTDTNRSIDVFVRAWQPPDTETVRVSVSVLDTQGNSHSRDLALSADGRFVAFGSIANNLVLNDTNDGQDIFVRARQPLAVPDAPSGLTATVARSNVAFNWQAPTTGAPPENYVFRVGLRPGDTIVDFATGSTATFYNATNVPAGTYYVRVHGRNRFGTGPPSNEIMLVTGEGACPEPPRAPTALSGSVRSGIVTFMWASSAGCPASSYVLEAGRSSGGRDLFVGDVGNVTVLTASALPGTYYVRVRGRNEYGLSGPSNEVTVVVP